MGAPESFTATTEVGHFINGKVFAAASILATQRPTVSPLNG